jgi:hypothetical protein
MKSSRSQVKRISGCEGKARFETFSMAEQTAHRQAQHKEGRFVAYACSFCGGFHVGTKLGDQVRASQGFDGRQRYAVYACDEFGRETIVGFTNDVDGGRVAEIICAEPGWMVTRIIDRHRRAA